MHNVLVSFSPIWVMFVARSRSLSAKEWAYSHNNRISPGRVRFFRVVCLEIGLESPNQLPTRQRTSFGALWLSFVRRVGFSFVIDVVVLALLAAFHHSG